MSLIYLECYFVNIYENYTDLFTANNVRRLHSYANDKIKTVIIHSNMTNFLDWKLGSLIILCGMLTCTRFDKLIAIFEYSEKFPLNRKSEQPRKTIMVTEETHTNVQVQLSKGRNSVSKLDTSVGTALIITSSAVAMYGRKWIAVVYMYDMYLCSMQENEIETPKESVERDHSLSAYHIIYAYRLLTWRKSFKELKIAPIVKKVKVTETNS